MKSRFIQGKSFKNDLGSSYQFSLSGLNIIIYSLLQCSRKKIYGDKLYGLWGHGRELKKEKFIFLIGFFFRLSRLSRLPQTITNLGSTARGLAKRDPRNIL